LHSLYCAPQNGKKKVDSRKIFEVSSQVRASGMNDILTMQQNILARKHFDGVVKRIIKPKRYTSRNGKQKQLKSKRKTP
jgi:hypothetical protein